MLHMPESHESATMQHIGQVIEDTVKRGVYGDTAPQNEDSRERLEADIYRAADEMEKFTHGEQFINVNKILRWLDRQAAITAEETSNAWEEYRDATQREIAELTAERDELQAKVDELIAECDSKEQTEPYLFGMSLDEVLGKLKQVDTLKSRHCPHYDATEHTCDVHRTRIAELTAEREQYRKLFGMALDWAHEITMLETSIDEGMA